MDPNLCLDYFRYYLKTEQQAPMFEKVTLEGSLVRLEPLSEAHHQGIRQAILDGELWKLFVTFVPHPDELDGFFKFADHCHAQGDGLAFATIDKRTGKVAGSTRFMKANLAHKRVEIGFTFLGKQCQKTPINTEAKLLMLTHAFEQLEMNRVEFLTDYFNYQSRNAILRLGAKQEGIMRNHMVMPNGRVRDTVMFSIIANVWPGVKVNFLFKLEQ